jgi:dihydroflavonol-4-reductase
MILITGGTGLVGSHILLELCKLGKPVRALYRPASDRQLVRKIFNYYSSSNDALYNTIQWVEGDITDVVSLEDAMKDVEYVYHCAALVSFNKRDRDKLEKINVEGTSNVVNACLDAKIKKLCYVSSVAALGKGIENKLLNEETKWTHEDDVSNYSISKHLAEQEVWRAGEEGLNIVMVNPCVILGPHNWNIGSTVIFKNMYAGVKYYTSGSNAVVDVRTVAEAMIKLMESDIRAERFLVISENLTFKDFCEKIAAALNKKPPTKKISRFMGGIGRRLEAIRAKFTGTQPRITKETLNAAFKQYSYSNEKIKTALPELNLRNADEAIKNSVAFFNEYYINQERQKP